MTKYILAGGCDRLYPEYFTQLARVIQAEVARPKLLSCWFSNHADEAEERFPAYREQMLTFFADGTEIVKAEKATFIDQIADADVVYLHGGHTDVLFEAMAEYGDLKSAFEGKIIVGSSAGANYLTRVGFSPGKNMPVDGSGILDIAVIVHYGSMGFNGRTYEPEFWVDAAKRVREYSGSDQILLLPEGSFSVIDV